MNETKTVPATLNNIELIGEMEIPTRAQRDAFMDILKTIAERIESEDEHVQQPANAKQN